VDDEYGRMIRFDDSVVVGEEILQKIDFDEAQRGMGRSN
jgi:hypothetical protein